MQLKSKGIINDVLEIKGEAGLEDMVFCANQTFPWVMEDGRKVVIMSKMKHESRQLEVMFFEEFFRDLGYEILHLQKPGFFEGMGDLIPHPGKRLLYGGYGHRTSEGTYEELEQLLDTPVITLELVDKRFYHLDTCFMPIDEQSVLISEIAFSSEGIEKIKKLYDNVVSIPIHEAAENFSLNSHCIRSQDQRSAILQQGNTVTIEKLRSSGYEISEIDTSEFIKSGGSVFCMKMMVY